MFQLLLITITVALLVKYIWDRWQQMQILKTHNIPGPEGSMWNGSLSDINKLGLHPFLEKNRNKYGSIWGYLEGRRPTLVISDVDALKQIYIKEFSKIYSRKHQLVTFESEYKNVFDAVDFHQWKRLRTIGSPTFSALKMKEMSPLINTCIDNILDLFEKRCQEGKPFDIQSDWQKLTLDVISTCAFGIETNSIKNPDSIFLEKLRGLFTKSESLSLIGKTLLPLILTFPGLAPYLSGFMMKLIPVFQIRDWFLETAKEIIKTRKENKSDRVDFIKLMLEANQAQIDEENLEMTADHEEEKEKKHVKFETTNEPQRINKQMTMQEMQANCFIMMTAGYETTSTMLSFAAYELALNPHILKKLQEEVDEHFKDKKYRPNYLTVHKMPYLDMFASEILRLHTIAAVASTRHISEPIQMGKYTIPAGFQIQIDQESVHMNPDHWGPEDPTHCVPERFLPERKEQRNPLAWIPFGAGPRNCIGMRFALMEAKIALVRVLQRFNIEKCDKTLVPLPLQKRIIKGPAEGVYVKLTHRE